MKTNLIAFTGLAGSGKNTAANLLQELCPELDVKQDAFADDLKWDIHEKLGVPRDVDKEILRPTYQAYGMLWRAIEPNYWINKVSERYKSFVRMEPVPLQHSYFAMDDGRRIEERDGLLYPVQPLYLITDCRFEDEAAWVKSQGGVIVRVEREGVKCGEHVSEAGQIEIVPDFTLQNCGTEYDLRLQVNWLLEQLQ